MKLFYALAIVALTVCWSSAATIERVIATYEYNTQGIASYQPVSASLYANGSLLCNGVIDQTDPGPLECNGQELEPGEQSFTVALQLANGRQTPHSQPIVKTIPAPIPEPEAPTVIEFYLRVTVDGQVYEFQQ